MAAPNSAYRSEVIHDGTTIANSAKGLIAIPSAEEAVLKARFYLDWIMAFEKDGVRGFIGGVTHLSDNYYMHNTARHYTLRGRGPAGQLIYWFNEAGLNTLGISIINGANLYWANNVRFNITFKSAWFVNTSQMGIQYRLAGSGTWNTHWILGESLPQQQQVTSNRLFDPNLAPGQNLQVRPIIVNNEGSYYGDIELITLLDRVYQYDAFFRTSACNDSGQINVSFWIKEGDADDLSTVTTTSSSTGIFFWKNIELTTKADSGWYMGLQEDKSFFVNSNGEVTHYQNCPVSPPVITLAVEEDVNGNMQVWATLDGPQPNIITVTGRIDVQPDEATPAGESFTITIAAGQVVATDPNFAMPRTSGVTYYWVGVGSAPGGYVINKQMPI